VITDFHHEEHEEHEGVMKTIYQMAVRGDLSADVASAGESRVESGAPR
jgi:hypothetical protein